MDEIVKAALKKWPNVPACHGWLALDARGDWYMRDDRVQAAGPFPRIKGSRIEHAKLIDFIARNYEHDAAGAWFFQNGAGGSDTTAHAMNEAKASPANPAQITRRERA